MEHTSEYIIHNILYITKKTFLFCYTDVAEGEKKSQNNSDTAILFLSIAGYVSSLLLQVNATAAGMRVKAPYYTTLKSFSSLAVQGSGHVAGHHTI